jgi:hypothetical protein
MSAPEFDTMRTHNAVCPYCGYEERDSWEINLGDFGEGDGETTCGSCSRDYFVSRICNISYTTKAKP